MFNLDLATKASHAVRDFYPNLGFGKSFVTKPDLKRLRCNEFKNFEFSFHFVRMTRSLR